jgi:hypothetical protein
MRSTHCPAAWIDSGCFIVCEHKHETLVDAVSCIPGADGYVVSIENGVMRSLSRKEESNFESVIRATFECPPLFTAVPAAGSRARASTGPGYAVMTRIKVVDYWSWSTWMCFDTYEQAAVHARKGDKVVRFASDEWVDLRQEKWVALPRQSDPVLPTCANEPPEILPSRAEGEPLVEFVLRLLNSLDSVRLLAIAGQKDDRT